LKSASNPHGKILKGNPSGTQPTDRPSKCHWGDKYRNGCHSDQDIVQHPWATARRWLELPSWVAWRFYL